jgi:DNA-binding NtrC family response regulator
MTESQVHILVVDDQRNIRNNLKTILEAAAIRNLGACYSPDFLLTRWWE